MTKWRSQLSALLVLISLLECFAPLAFASYIILVSIGSDNIILVSIGSDYIILVSKGSDNIIRGECLSSSRYVSPSVRQSVSLSVPLFISSQFSVLQSFSSWWWWKFMKVDECWWRLMKVEEDWWSFIKIEEGWWRLMEVYGGWWRLVEVGGGW